VSASSKLEQQVVKLNCELKKRENEILKLQDHVKRLMGMDKLFFQNSVESSAKALQGVLIQKSLPEQEFHSLLKLNGDAFLSRVQQENDQLKDLMLLLHTELKQAMDAHLAGMGETLKDVSGIAL